MGKKTARQILADYLKAEAEQSMKVLASPLDPGTKFTKGEEMKEFRDLKRAAEGIMKKKARVQGSSEVTSDVVSGVDGEISG